MSNPHSDLFSTSANEATEQLLAELKTRARLRLNALHSGDPIVTAYAKRIARKRRWPLPSEWKLQHALNLVAAESDFRDWEHVRRVLSGLAKPGDDMGGLWYSPACMALFNHWYASYAEAKEFHQQAHGRWLFPYGRQFVVGDVHYIDALSLDPDSPLWNQVERDLCACYGTVQWQQLCAARLNATRGLLPPTSSRF